jgi:hypothetical protein
MIRVRGANVHPQAVGAVLATRPAFGRYAVVAAGDPVEPPHDRQFDAQALRLYT